MQTVVFADIVGSTRIFEQLGDEAASRLVTELVGDMGQIVAHNNGRVVKALGDGLFAVFPGVVDAICASIDIQKQTFARPKRADGGSVQVQIGLDAGDVVEIDGDCFGDTVNSAARLADLAGAAQILTTENVWGALVQAHRALLRSMGPMYLRGKLEASHVYRVEWQDDRDDDATMVRRSLFSVLPDTLLEVGYHGRTIVLGARDAALTIGRSGDTTLMVDDKRVSRSHASVQWRGGQFVLADTSTYGTWIYFGNQDKAVVLRRTECVLAGSGVLVPGCERTQEGAPQIRFSVKN